MVFENCLVLSPPPESYTMKMQCSWLNGVYHTGLWIIIKIENPWGGVQ